MAMTQCPACGKDISDRGKICPYCRTWLESNSTEQAANLISDSGQYEAVKPGHVLITLFFVFLVVAVGFAALGIWFYPASGWLLYIILAFIAGFIAVVCLYTHIKTLREYRLSQRDNEAYQKLMREKTEAYNSKVEQEQREQEEQEQYRLARLPECPICGTKQHVKRISTFNRSVSVAAVGLASAKIGKQYECKNCGHMW